VEADRQPTLDFADTLEIKVVEGSEAVPGETLSFDSYFFAYFVDLDASLAKIREVVETFKAQDGRRGSRERATLYDTTIKAHHRRDSVEREEEGEKGLERTSTGSSSKIGGLLHPFSFNNNNNNSSSSDKKRDSIDEAPIPVKKRASIDPYHPAPQQFHLLSSEPMRADSTDTLVPSRSRSDAVPTTSSDHNYPPSKSFSDPPSDHSDIDSPSTGHSTSSASRLASKMKSVLPSALGGSGSKKKKRRETADRRRGRMVTESVEPQMLPVEGGLRGGGERLSSSSLSDADADGMEGESGYSMMEASESRDKEEREAEKEFRDAFALPQEEMLLERSYLLQGPSLLEQRLAS
jgi:hypothetical protein